MMETPVLSISVTESSQTIETNVKDNKDNDRLIHSLGTSYIPSSNLMEESSGRKQKIVRIT